LNERNDSTAIVLEYIDCINAGNPKKLITLQTEDFTFIDMKGDKFVGRDGWESYFTQFPDYRIHVQQTLLSGDGVAIIGKTTGSHVDPKIEVLETILWIAEVRDGLVSFWRIYSDLNDAKKKLQ
jgi:ketosteroid isomerase-like protein